MDPRTVGRALIALAIGGFAIGTTEFATMGILPQVATGTAVDIPTAGHYVSAYALGVVVGAPVIATLAARQPRKRVLLVLMLAVVATNVASALAGSYWPLMAARFAAGLPHGAFFGIGAVLAASLVEPARRTWAVSMTMVGLGASNVIGVPVATAIGQRWGWPTPYLFVAAVGVVTLLAVARWVPERQRTETGAQQPPSMRGELSALTHLQVWLALLIGTVGFGGMFSTYAFITPTLTELGGFSESVVPILLAVYGVGMVTGMVLAGRVAPFGLMRGIIATLAAIAVMLAVFGYAVRVPVLAVVSLVLLGLLPSILVPLLQTRLMDVARDGQALAAALNHSTLNMANALGAWLGSVVLAAGYGYEWPSRVGVLLAVAGIAVALVSVLVGRRTWETGVFPRARGRGRSADRADHRRAPDRQD